MGEVAYVVGRDSEGYAVGLMLAMSVKVPAVGLKDAQVWWCHRVEMEAVERCVGRNAS